MEIIDSQLKKIGTYINGKAFKPSDWSVQGIPIIRIENLNNSDARYNYFEGSCDEKYHVNNGDILLSWSATLDTFIWSEGAAYLNQHIFKVLLDEEQLNRRFGFYLLKYAIREIAQIAHGSTMVHVTKPVFDNFKIRFPKSKSRQEQIAIKLDTKFEAIQEMLEAALMQKEAVQALQHAVLKEMFPFDAGEKLPVGWHWVKLKQEADFKNGINYTEADVKKGVKIVGVGSFKKYFYVKEELLEEVCEDIVGPANYLKDGDMVIVRSNGNPQLVGRHILFRGSNPVTHSGFTIRIRLNQEVLFPEYYLLYSKTSYFKDQIKGQGSNISNLSQDKLKKVVIPAPIDVTTQQEITERYLAKVQEIEDLSILIETQLEAIEALYFSTLRETFITFKKTSKV